MKGRDVEKATLLHRAEGESKESPALISIAGPIFRNIVCLRVKRERRTSLCSAKSCMSLQTAYVMVDSSGLRTGSRRKKTEEFDVKD
ncbi:hypothetical protein ZIOFF_019211 [Zingiber officinale]|uniref:Uncharacterized protein n=1 Tax=Zingiber officinale TaxID=94328 RepID=A0A8J5HRB6_ZINOF|nr:hypothetical protein ZIOFF_019211 [Zingiber officinale]